MPKAFVVTGPTTLGGDNTATISLSVGPIDGAFLGALRSESFPAVLSIYMEAEPFQVIIVRNPCFTLGELEEQLAPLVDALARRQTQLTPYTQGYALEVSTKEMFSLYFSEATDEQLIADLNGDSGVIRVIFDGERPLALYVYAARALPSAEREQRLRHYCELFMGRLSCR